MFKKMLRLLDSEVLKVFIHLWFEDRSTVDLGHRSGISVDRLEVLLPSLEEAGLLEVSSFEPYTIWQVNQSFREKLSKNLLQLLTTIAVSGLATLIAIGDHALINRQTNRVNKKLRRARK